MAMEADAAAPAPTAADSVSEMVPMSPAASSSAASSAPARPRGWLRKLIPRGVGGDYHQPRSSGRGRWAAAGASRLASSLSRSLRWKRLPGLSLSSLSLRSGGSAAAVVDAVAFRVMYVVEAVVLGLALSCFFLCCGCHL